VVARRGGTIVSPEYVSSQTKLRYRCREGHAWDAVPNSILTGTWCPVCGRRRQLEQHAGRKSRVYRRLQRIAKRQGGDVLSPAFPGSKTPLRLRCARGHTWEALAASIESGVWCATCREESVLAELRALAERWGGACLSESYRHGRERLLWQCRQGHRWKAPAEMIRRGIWCPGCRLPTPGDMERMRRIARERGGECLSTEYINSETKLRWRCHNNHEWEQLPSRIVQGTWCRACERGWGRGRRRLNIETMHQMAADRGGTCLSTKYRGVYGRLRWRCARGHIWVTPANNVRRGCWCPACAHTARGTLDGMRALAIERGGRCLNSAWDDHKQPLRFECREGHVFQARGNAVKSGAWCRLCRETSQAPSTA
jgi:hypothetical protein